MPYRHDDPNDMADYHLPAYSNTAPAKRPRRRRCFTAVLTACLLGVVGATLVNDAHAVTVADSHVIAPHRTWVPKTMNSPVISGPGLSPALRLYSGGVRLARACPAGFDMGTSSCRYYKTRPRSACRVICPMLAVIPGWGPLRIKNISDRRVRVEYRRYLPCPVRECGD